MLSDKMNGVFFLISDRIFQGERPPLALDSEKSKESLGDIYAKVLFLSRSLCSYLPQHPSGNQHLITAETLGSNWCCAQGGGCGYGQKAQGAGHAVCGVGGQSERADQLHLHAASCSRGFDRHCQRAQHQNGRRLQICFACIAFGTFCFSDVMNEYQ